MHLRTPVGLTSGQTYTNQAERLEIHVVSQVAGGFIVEVRSSEHPDCQQIRDAIEEACAEIRTLQEDLRNAAPGEKAAIIRQIRAWQAKLKEAQQRGVQLGCRRG